MIKELELINWKNHKKTELEFSKGVNAIIGYMGSGKSSIVQAISFSLFGTFSELKGRDLKINELLNRKENKDSVLKLKFTDLEENKYQVIRNISKKGSYDAILKDIKGNLFSGPQIQEVNKSIQRLLKINENVWLKTVYSRQNDIDYFLKISPLKRKIELDELMGLNKFENARKNIIKLINFLKTSADEKGKVLEEFDVEHLNQNIKDISNELEKLKKEKIILQSQESEAEEQKKKIKESLDYKKNKVNELNILSERKLLIEKELEKIQKILQNIKIEKNKDFEKEFLILKEEISKTQLKKQELSENIEIIRSEYHELEKKLGILNEKKIEIDNSIETHQKLKKELFLYENIEQNLEKLSEKRNNTQSYIDNKKGELENLKRHLGELMVAENTCPVCSNELDKNTKNKLISKRKQEIFEKESKIKDFEKELLTLNDNYQKLREKNKQRSKILNRLEDFENLEGKKEEIINKSSEYRKNKLKISEELSNKEEILKKTEEKLYEFSERYHELQEEKNVIERIKEQDSFKKELENIVTSLEKNQDVSKELSIIEDQYEEIIKKIQEIQTKRKYISEYGIDEKGQRLIDLIKNKEEINKLEKKIYQIRKKIEFLNKFKNSIIYAQGELRRELILAVNEVMSNLWQELYPYDKWSSLRLLANDEDYLLQLKETNGDWLSVTGFASGGERMIASLALRIAFSKILAPNLDLLILDEPTHNLDKNAIETLTQIIEEKLPLLINQIFIITHEEKLAESATNLIKIE